MMAIIIGADPSGLSLKNVVKEYLLEKGYDVTDVTQDNEQAYYSVGFEVGKAISKKEYDMGFIFCGTGMGVNIVANKFSGVYSALCESVETATLSRKINNANVLAMGGLLITPFLAKQMVDAFLNTEFSYGFSEGSPEYLQNAYQTIQELEPTIVAENNKK